MLKKQLIQSSDTALHVNLEDGQVTYCNTTNEYGAKALDSVHLPKTEFKNEKGWTIKVCIKLPQGNPTFCKINKQ